MKFGSVPLDRAQGSILAHSITLTGPGPRPEKIAKGSVLDESMIAKLALSGLSEVIAATLEDGDVHEDSAALSLARALVPDPVGQGIRITGAGAGRVNLYAQGPGVVELDRARLEAVNAIDPMISVATVPKFHRVDADGMIATIKIIAYAVSGTDLERASLDAAGAIRIVPPAYRTATLIETVTADDVPSDKGRAAMTGRLDRLGVTLSPRVVTRHAETPLSEAVAEAPGDVVFILTGSATSDPLDVAPQAVRRVGGSVTRFGMPVDPGNLLFLGQYGEKPVIGLPGCARSPALNGADWVLERVLCGVEVSSADIAAMGVGGLLKEIPTRPMPRREKG